MCLYVLTQKMCLYILMITFFCNNKHNHLLCGVVMISALVNWQVKDFHFLVSNLDGISTNETFDVVWIALHMKD